jgi:hypothetical protein
MKQASQDEMKAIKSQDLPASFQDYQSFSANNQNEDYESDSEFLNNVNENNDDIISQVNLSL